MNKNFGWIFERLSRRSRRTKSHINPRTSRSALLFSGAHPPACEQVSFAIILADPLKTSTSLKAFAREIPIHKQFNAPIKADPKTFRIRQVLANFWSPEEKRKAHNLKVEGSNPSPRNQF